MAAGEARPRSRPAPPFVAVETSHAQICDPGDPSPWIRAAPTPPGRPSRHRAPARRQRPQDLVAVRPGAALGFFSGQVGYHGVREDMLKHSGFPAGGCRCVREDMLGHLGKASASPPRYLQGFRLVAVDAFDPG